MTSSPQVLDEAHALKCDLAGEVLRSSGILRLRVMGWSMLPSVWPGDTLVIEPIISDGVLKGDIVMFSSGRRFVAHRVMARRRDSGDWRVQTQGDAVPSPDSPVDQGHLLGKVSFILRKGKCIEPRRNLSFPERAAAAVFQRSAFAARVVVGVHGLRQSSQGASRVQAALLQER